MGLSRHETHNSTLISSFNKSPKINVFRREKFTLNLGTGGGISRQSSIKSIRPVRDYSKKNESSFAAELSSLGQAKMT